MNDQSPLWMQRLSRSLHLSRSKPESRYFQLATVSEWGPQIRTVVFRGFGENHEQLCFITDTRSQKYTEIQQNPKVSACWYFTKSREQYRFSGTVAIDNSDSIQAVNAWRDLSENGKKQFLWGVPKSDFSDSEEQGNETQANDDNNVCVPEHFCVMTIHVEMLDYLNLKEKHKGIPQCREVYQYTQSGWHCRSVVP